jgi:hypothetical protein
MSAEEDKGYNLGYLSTVTRDLESALMDMERYLEPVLSVLQVGENPQAHFGRGVSQRIREADDSKMRAWSRIRDLKLRLGELREREENGTPIASQRVAGKPAGVGVGARAVKVVISGTLLED